MAHLVDFLPFEAAAWLETQLYGKTSIRIVGPPGSGKTTLLTVFAETVGYDRMLGGLSERDDGLACLRNNGRSMSLSVPILAAAGRLQDVTDMILRQGVETVVVDSPSDATWSLLHDIERAGPRVWAASVDNRLPLEAEIRIQLGLTLGGRVELVTVEDRPVYWLAGNRVIFDPGPS